MDQIGGGHLVRDTDKQFKDLLNEEENRLIQYLNSASDKQILDAIRRERLKADRFRNGNLINSSINSVAFADITNHPHSSDLNDQSTDQLFMDQFIDRDILNNVRENNRRIIKNLDQIGGGYLVRNLDQIGSGHLVRNLDQIGGGHLVRNLNQIGKEHLVRNLDQIGGGQLLRNLDQIGGGHLVRNLDQIGGGNLVRTIDYQNAEKRRVDESASISEKQHFTRNLDHIGGGNLVRNLDQIGGGNLVRNLDQIGGGNLVRNLN